jgi:hypothetical protein
MKRKKSQESIENKTGRRLFHYVSLLERRRAEESVGRFFLDEHVRKYIDLVGIVKASIFIRDNAGDRGIWTTYYLIRKILDGDHGEAL